MKKLGLIAMAIATLAFVGCDPKDPKPTADVNSVTLSKTELTMQVGESMTLKATTDPAGGEITWTSSDAKIVSVSKGTVVANAEGSAIITASCGDKSATCNITVTNEALYEAFNVAGFGLFGSEFEPIAGTDTVITLTNGSTVNCNLNYITWYGWDGDLTYIDGGTGWAGDGLFIVGGKVPVYVINGGEYDGYYIGTQIWTMGFEENAGDIMPYNCGRGFVDPATYGDWVSYVYGDSIDGVIDQEIIWSKTDGALFTYWSVTEDFNYANYGLYYGFINKLIFMEEDEDEGIEAAFWADIDWANLTADDRAFGFLFDLDHYNATYVEGEGGEMLFARPYDYAQVHKVLGSQELYDYLVNGEEESRYHLGGKLSDLPEMPLHRGEAMDMTKFHMAR